MTSLKYSKYIVTEPRPIPPELRKEIEARRRESKSTVESTHLMTVDSDIIEDMFYIDCVWLWKGSSEDKVEESHTHDFDEVIGFIGSDREDPQSLGGEITIWLDDEKHVLDKTCLIFIPAVARHCPIIFNRIDKPIFFITLSPSKKYTRTPTGDGKPVEGVAVSECKIITEVSEFDGSIEGAPPKAPRESTSKGAHVMHLEDNVVEGSFYIDFVWIYEGTGAAPPLGHNHDWEEVIAMVGCDPENPNNLGGEMSLVLGDETHYFTKNSMVCIPKGLKHCPWKWTDIKKPTLVFTAGPSGRYSGSHKG